VKIKRGFAHGYNIPNKTTIIQFFNLHTRKKHTSSGFSIEPLPMYVVNQLYTIANVHYNFLFIAVIKNVESQNIPMIKCSAITVLTQVIRIRNYSQETNLCKQHINHISLPYACLIISKFFRTCIKLTKE